MSADVATQLSEAEYFALERTSEQKHEYYAGVVVAQAGGSAAHNRITMNTLNSLYVQLDNRPCSVYSSDMRVKIPFKKSYVYPDGAVVCGEERFDDTGQETLLNPVVIIEVLSPSTEHHDRGTKFEWYRSIESVQEYVLIAQNSKRIDYFRRQSENMWVFMSIGVAEERLHLESIDCILTISAVYRNVAVAE